MIEFFILLYIYIYRFSGHKNAITHLEYIEL